MSRSYRKLKQDKNTLAAEYSLGGMRASPCDVTPLLGWRIMQVRPGAEERYETLN